MLAVASGVAALTSNRTVSPNVVGPEGVLMTNAPLLASASSSATGAPVDGLTCRPEKDAVIKYHVHVHLAIFVDGVQKALPAGVGITKPYLTEHLRSGTFLDTSIYDCLYWLHTHVADGIIHVEAPAKATFTLGQFFDVWRQPLSATQVGPAHGAVVVFSNGRRVSGSPRDVALPPGGDLQIDVGAPVVAFQPFPFKVSGLCGQGTAGCAVPAKK
ncbi:MAG: hypothetical protein KGL79_01700 [Acidobacteriota bacterium]|nr:hypothetical protein [Acidobacteriota bacterium]